MKFEDALKAMRDGKKIRRSCWKLCIEFENIKNNLVAFNACDLIADDWEIVEEKEKLRMSVIHTASCALNQSGMPTISDNGTADTGTHLLISIPTCKIPWIGRKIKVTVETID